MVVRLAVWSVVKLLIKLVPRPVTCAALRLARSAVSMACSCEVLRLLSWLLVKALTWLDVNAATPSVLKPASWLVVKAARSAV